MVILMEKINNIKGELAKEKFTKSGKNNNGKRKFTYLELSDFLPTLNKLCIKEKVFFNFNFDNGRVLLYVVNIENPEEVLESGVPFKLESAIDSKGKPYNSKTFQDTGAGMTYYKRKLLINFFDIFEDCYVDSNGVEEKETSNISKSATKNDSNSAKKPYVDEDCRIFIKSIKESLGVDFTVGNVTLAAKEKYFDEELGVADFKKVNKAIVYAKKLGAVL